MLKGKNILLGVTGGIACYKSCEIVSRLVKLGANVDVIMTNNATKFVAPKTFESLSHRPVVTDTFSPVQSFNIEHISLAQKADLILIAPATANVIGKIACGIADDMLTTTVMASTNSIKLIAPAMNTGMFNNMIFQFNMNTLKGYGYHFEEPTSGRLACGDVGVGKMQEPEILVERVVQLLSRTRDLEGKKVLITCGGTEEAIDAVRVITNHSSGKMGIAIASECHARGAIVKLVYGSVSVCIPNEFSSVYVISTDDMYNAVIDNTADSDYIIMAAAPSDYKPVVCSNEKIKSKTITLELVKNVDIARAVGKIKGDKKLIIFSAETSNLIENASNKLVSKNADMVVANDVTVKGAGFNVDTNIVTIINTIGQVVPYDIMPKTEVATVIVDSMLKL